ncbi:MAG: BREX-2 system phosphatase PglZ, partial [Pseudonocardia sp.]
NASVQAPGGALLIEEVLDVVVTPLATADAAPLVLVLDGMSAAVAAELGEQLAARAWVEVSPELDRRAAAVATIPSVTRASRTSLLTGRPQAGDQSTETQGFAAFWRRHRRTATLAHKADIGGSAGHRLAEPLVAALAGGDVVGVVLNTIDDALDHGREGDRTTWRLADITYLPELLDAARSYRRPVVLVGDHGHVLERSPTGTGASGAGLTAAEGVESARWRTGEPGVGEVALAGPRVLLGDGRVVVPWREDIRYTRRRSGYHGGASLAEMAVPILVMLPSVDLLPAGWSVIAPESTVPLWWTGRPVTEPPAPVRKAAPIKKVRAAKPVVEGLFDVPEVVAPTPVAAPAATTLGSRVVGSPVYEVQRKFVPRAPDRAAIAGLVDTLARADGRMSPIAVAAAVGRAGRDPDFVVATVQRLLNVEGYAVLSVEGGRTVRLNVDLLCQQFGVTA